MDMEFQVGQSVTFGFDIGGSAPAPPAPPAPQSPGIVFGNPIATGNGYGHYFKPALTPCDVIYAQANYTNGFRGFITGLYGAAATTRTINTYFATPTPAKTLAVVMHGSQITFSGEGYHYLAASQPISVNGETLQVSVYEKDLAAYESLVPLTLTQQTEARLDAINVFLSGENIDLTLIDSRLTDIRNSDTKTVPNKTDKRRLYVLLSYDADDDYPEEPYFKMRSPFIEFENAGFNRMGVFYDHGTVYDTGGTGLSATQFYIDHAPPTITENGCAILTFDVTGDF